MTKTAARFRAVRSFTDAALLFVAPKHVLETISEDRPVSQSVLQILFWGVLAGALDSAAILLGVQSGSGDFLPILTIIVLAGPFFLATSAVFTLAYHGLAKLARGKAALRTSFHIVAALIPLLTADIIFGRIPFIRIPFLLFKFYLAFLSVELVHRAERKRALYVFGPAFALVLLVNLRFWIAG